MDHDSGEIDENDEEENNEKQSKSKIIQDQRTGKFEIFGVSLNREECNKFVQILNNAEDKWQKEYDETLEEVTRETDLKIKKLNKK